MIMRNRFLYTTRYMKMAPDDGSGGASSAPSPSGDGGGASVSPSPSGGDSGGSPPASPSPDSGSTETASPWENLGSSDDLDFIEIQQQRENAPVAPPPEVTPPAPAPVATPAPVAEVQPPAPAAPQQQPAAQEQQPAPSLSPADPAGIAEAMYEHRAEAIAHLAQDRFALSPEDIAELETDAAAFVPKMMARVAFETQASMYKFLAQSVPGMIAKHTTVSKANTEAEDKFFTINKDRGLDPKNAEHKAMAARLASMYRQANPKMPFDQLASEVGLMVQTALKLAPQTPGTPIAAPRGGQPFRPAVGGGGGASPAPAPADEWAGLGRNFDEG